MCYMWFCRSCEERRIHLSSIRAPRSNRGGSAEPYAREAKEFLRSKLIGKRVSVEVEYVIESQTSDRTYGTITLQSKKKSANVAVMLLEAGLATLIGHKTGAERSNYYHGIVSPVLEYLYQSCVQS